jgi:hypothetical protein
MKRRQLLAGTGALAVGALSGCLASAPGDDGAPTDEATDSATPSVSPTPTPALSNSTFTVESVDSGQGNNDAAVSFDNGVLVDGTIGGRNGCYTASLTSTSYEDGTLTVVVRAHEREDAEMCTEALVDIDYRATFTFSGDQPGKVVVEHRSLGERRTVATASH